VCARARANAIFFKYLINLKILLFFTRFYNIYAEYKFTICIVFFKTSNVTDKETLEIKHVRIKDKIH